MWVLRFSDGGRGILLLREYILEGRVLMFEHEEQALRFSQQIAPTLSSALGVRVSVIKLSADPKKEKLLKVSQNLTEKYARILLQSLE